MIKVIITSILLGFALAMDATAISMANGLKKPNMKIKNIILISLLFAIFQGIMPLIGYLVGFKIITKFDWIIPWLALFVLLFLGIKMIFDGIKNKENIDDNPLTIKFIFLEAIATSIDALSVGLTLSNYSLKEAIICFIIIALITFICCIIGVIIGKKSGMKLGNKAIIIGGIILIIIGLEIFITSFF